MTKKACIEKVAEELKNHILPPYKEIAFYLENQIVKLDEGYEMLTTKISSQGEKWQREIDIIIKKMKIKISEIKVKHRDILHKQLDKIKHI